MSAQANVQPHFTVTPKPIIEAYQGDNVNFTWFFSEHALNQAVFGLFDTNIRTVTTNLMVVDVVNNTYVASPKIYDKTKNYDGRLSFKGDKALRRITIELSDVRYTDKKYYGIEVNTNKQTNHYKL